MSISQEEQNEYEKQSKRLREKSIPISPDELKKEALVDMKEALAYFIERQKLVAQAMTEMGLDLDEVAKYGALAWVSDLPPDENGNIVKLVEKFKNYADSENASQRKLYQIAKRASERNLPQYGIWRDSQQNEWEYMLHGGGCHLKNIKTGEPIDWDPPDLNSYDEFKFMDNLLWQISYPKRTIKLGFLRSVVQQALKPLIKEVRDENLSTG